MEKLTHELKIILKGKRNFTRSTFLLLGTIYRGINKNRFTLEQGLKALDNLGGTK